MVGVPRSKGCHNCRRRKKGCDLARPSCERCVRFRLTCNGYPEDLRFVQVDPGSVSSTSQAHRRDKYESPEPSFELIVAPPQGNGLSSQPVTLVQSALRVQYNGLLWDDLTPHQSGRSSIASGSQLPPSLSWMHSAFEQSYDDPALSTALSALSIARRSRVSQNTDLEHTAGRLHVSALQQVRKRLTDQHSYHDDSLVATVMLLASYEVFEGSTDGQRAAVWISHVRGASQMIALRGSQGSKSPFAAQLQYAARYNDLIDAISTRREIPERSFDVLSGLNLDQKASDEMELYRVLSQFPRLLATAETLSEPLANDVLKPRMAGLIIEYQAFQGRLEGWLGDVQAQYDGPLYWFEPSELYAQLPESSLERIFPQRIRFIDLSIAHLQLLYWTAQLLLRSVLFFSCQVLMKGNVDTDLVINFATEVDAIDSSVCHDLACKLAQSVECLMDPDAGLVGAQILGFPISVARGCLLLLKSRDIVWFNVIFRRLLVLDVRLEGFLDDMALGARGERRPRQLLQG